MWAGRTFRVASAGIDMAPGPQSNAATLQSVQPVRAKALQNPRDPASATSRKQSFEGARARAPVRAWMLCVCLRVCMCVCMCSHMCVRVYTRACLWVCLCPCAHLRLHLRNCASACLCLRTTCLQPQQGHERCTD
eukprot:5197353-Alexandrium_andersonii.AAC.3